MSTTMTKRQMSDVRAVKPLLLSIPEVAASLRVCRATVYRLIDTQGLPVVRLGRRGVRVSVAALERWVQEQGEK